MATPRKTEDARKSIKISTDRLHARLSKLLPVEDMLYIETQLKFVSEFLDKSVLLCESIRIRKNKP